jgi:hypothetical protein
METIVITGFYEDDDGDGLVETVFCIEYESKEAFLKDIGLAAAAWNAAKKVVDDWHEAARKAQATLHMLQHKCEKLETLRPEQTQALLEAEKNHNKCRQNRPAWPISTEWVSGRVRIELWPFLREKFPARVESLEEWRRRKVEESSTRVGVVGQVK